MGRNKEVTLEDIWRLYDKLPLNEKITMLTYVQKDLEKTKDEAQKTVSQLDDVVLNGKH